MTSTDESGKQMHHTVIWKEVKRLCGEAGLQVQRGFTRSLYLQYVEARQKNQGKSVEESGKRYFDLLQTEET